MRNENNPSRHGQNQYMNIFHTSNSKFKNHAANEKVNGHRS